MDRPRILALAAIPAAFIVAILLSACGPYSAAWRTTSAIHSAGGMADKALSAAVEVEATKCKKAGHEGEALKSCVRDTKAWEAVKAWRSIGLPAVNSAIVTTVAALQIAEKTGEKKLDWIAILKPAACALARVVQQWGEHMGTAKGAVMVAAGALKGVSCE